MSGEAEGFSSKLFTELKKHPDDRWFSKYKPNLTLETGQSGTGKWSNFQVSNKLQQVERNIMGYYPDSNCLRPMSMLTDTLASPS